MVKSRVVFNISDYLGALHPLSDKIDFAILSGLNNAPPRSILCLGFAILRIACFFFCLFPRDEKHAMS